MSTKTYINGVVSKIKRKLLPQLYGRGMMKGNAGIFLTKNST
jgi:hypothetical protein